MDETPIDEILCMEEVNLSDEDSEEDENYYKGEDTKNITNKIKENIEKFILT